jgi:hypothetical protein
MAEKHAPPLDAGVRVVISASVPMALLLSIATADEICEESWPEFRRALKHAIEKERLVLGVRG